MTAPAQLVLEGTPAPLPRRGRRGRRAAPLGKHTDSVGGPERELTPVEAAKLLRRKAYDLLDMVGKFTTNSRTQHCCRTRIPKGNRSAVTPGGMPYEIKGGISDIEIRRKAGVAYLGGVLKCGSVWLCPVCATRVAGERRAEIDRIGALHVAGGGAIAFCTLTSSHDGGMNPGRFLVRLRESWRAVQRSRGYRGQMKRLKAAGFLKKLEVTYGRNGFHPHLHLAFFFDRDFTRPAPMADGTPREPAELVVLQKVIFAEWRKAFVDAGYPPPSERRGTKLEYVTPGSTKWRAYLAKMGFEITGTKEGRNGNRSMWEVLQDAGLAWTRCLKEGYSPIHVNRQTGEVHQVLRDVIVWRQYEKMIKGARQLEWSRALKKRYAVSELTDEQLVLGELDTTDELVLRIPKASELWREVLAQSDGIAQVIEAASEGMESLWDLFLEWGLDRKALRWCQWGDQPDEWEGTEYARRRDSAAA